eukprot:scaffold213509_cov16-Tisochrysis_lutea.AAC.1
MSCALVHGCYSPSSQGFSTSSPQFSPQHQSKAQWLHRSAQPTPGGLLRYQPVLVLGCYIDAVVAADKVEWRLRG